MKNSFLGGRSTSAKTTSDGPDYLRVVTNRIKPHFVNNILSSIYYLCDMEPERAQSITMDLSGYMLGALNVVENREPVLFSSELEVIRKYLSLEKLRFEDRMHVNYDIDVDGFKVPPLTILSIVENAVKHGIAENDRSGTLQITTRRVAEGSQIRITDDGIGFDTAEVEKKDNELAIIRQIIKNAGGQMTLESTPGNGTTVTVTFKD